MGRNKKPLDQKVSKIHFSMQPEDLMLLDELAKQFGWTRSRTIKYLLRCVSQKREQALRNKVYKLYVDDVVNETRKRLEQSPGKGNVDYHAIVKAFVTFGNVKTASQELQEAVDQQNHYNQERAKLESSYYAEMQRWEESGHPEFIVTFDEWLMEKFGKEEISGNVKDDHQSKIDLSGIAKGHSINGAISI